MLDKSICHFLFLTIQWGYSCFAAPIEWSSRNLAELVCFIGKNNLIQL